MANSSRSSARSQIEATIAELDDTLRAATPSAAVRELRVRHGALARVVRAWGTEGPHAAQLDAMRECVDELHDAVRKACPARSRDGTGGAGGRGKEGGASRPPGRPGRAIPAKAAKSVNTTRPPPKRAANAAGNAAGNGNSGTTRPPPRRASTGAPPSSRRG